MGIFNEFNKKEKPFFTGIARGFGFGGGATTTSTAPSGPVIYTGASGGVIQTYSSPDGTVFKSHIFTSPGNFVVSSLTGITDDAGTASKVEYLIVGGGGGGGFQHGGGGGAGGVYTSNPGAPSPRRGSPAPIAAATYAVVVGKGGNGHTSNSASYPQPKEASQGGDSSFAYNGGTHSVGGGGRGGNYEQPSGSNRTGDAKTGGSGGGGGSTESDGASSGGNVPDGNKGSNGGGGRYAGGGGGGWLTAGSQAPPVSPYNGTPRGGDGGLGGQILMTAEPTDRQLVGSFISGPGAVDSVGGYFAGGGGGGSYNGAVSDVGSRGVMGGGHGGRGAYGATNTESQNQFGRGAAALAEPNFLPQRYAVGAHGEQNSGGGGGGSGRSECSGGRGGNGVVVVRYKIPSSASNEHTFAKATGGAVTVYDAPADSILGAGKKVLHVFVGPGSFDVTSTIPQIEYVVIGGGGGGGCSGGGGGAGSYVHGTEPNLGTGNYAVLVGEGGMGRGNTAQSEPGQNGQDSLLSIPNAVPAISGGGGGGGTGNAPGQAGGSPGGAGEGGSVSSRTGTDYPGDSDDASPGAGWGYAGGTAAGGPQFGGGGGGGAGGAGGNAPTTLGGVGGVGIRLPSTFRSPLMAPNGTDGGGLGVKNPGAPSPTQLFWVCGGGAGGLENTGSGSAGGAGGGGSQDGTQQNAVESMCGRTNTGSGGAGSNQYNGNNAGGSGGSGLILIAYNAE